MRSADPSLAAAERIDAACDRFESEWKAGRRPRIDAYLAAAPEPDRAELRQALLALEAELRGGAAADTSATTSSVRSPDGPEPVTVGPAAGAGEAAPTTIGRFAIRGALGAGAFGQVYRAFDPQLGREVAIKVPLETAVRTDAERARFLKEARAAATINHPNVCQIHEVGEADGRPYIVMALVPGQSLADVLKSRKEPLPEKQAAQIARKIALALAAAHKKGIVHRDLKPANVMFDRERKDIIVMDFGLARGPRLADGHGTQSGVIMGTPAYMSPEQAQGKNRSVGPAADIFGLGVILYELLCGRRPFTGNGMEVLCQILMDDPPPASQHRPGLDSRLEAICQKAMAKDPAARFATMKEFAAAIDAVVRTPPAAETARAGQTRQGEGLSTNAALADVFAAMVADRQQARAETAAAVEAAVRRHRTPRWVFVLAGLLFIGGLAALAGLVFYFQTDKVKVTLELTDVDLSDKTLSFILDEEPISAEALAGPIELKPGDHVLVVKRGKEIVNRILITVTGGRSPGIRAKPIPPPAPPPEHKLSPEAEDRKFAEWLVSIGANVTVSVDGGPGKGVGKRDDPRPLPQRLADLPKEPFRVTAFDSWCNPEITDRAVDPILRWVERRGIDRVSFFGNPVGDETVRRLVKLPSLKRINLGATKVTPACLPILATRTDLVYLSLQERPIGDQDLEKLHGLVNLEWLTLAGTNVTDAGLKRLRDLKRLRTLGLDSTAVTGAGLDELAGLPIEQLSLGNTKVRGAEGLARLKKLPELKGAELPGLLLGSADLKPLTECKSIVHLGLHDNRITDAGLDELARMKWLRFVMLKIGGATNPVTAAGVERLRKALPNCNVVYEGSDEPTPADARAAALQLLKSGASLIIQVDGQGMSVTDSAKLPAGPFTVTKIEMDGRKGADALLALVKRLFPAVEDISFGSTDVTNAGMQHLRDMPRLKAVFCEGTEIDDRGFAALADLKQLESLWAAVTGLGNDGARVLAGLPNLRYVRASSTRIDDAGLLALKKAPKLDFIELQGTAVTDAGLAHLIDYPALKTIYLDSTKITNAGLAHLAKCNRLKHLSLAGTKVTEKGLADLRKALPGCEILPEPKAPK